MIKKLIKNSLLLLTLNLAGGFFIYLCQLVAAKKLSVVDYSLLIVAFSYFGILLSPSSIIQSFAVLRSGIFKNEKTIKFFAIIILILSILLFIPLWFIKTEFSILTILLFGFPCALVTSFLTGALQGRQLFFGFGLTIFIGSFIRFAGAYLSKTKEQLAIAAGIGLIAMLITAMYFILKNPNKEAHIKHNKISLDLTLSFLTALGFALFPSFDLLNVKWIFHNDTLVGQYGQLQLFSKIVYFAPAALLQVTFPYYVKAYATGLDIREHKKVRIIETLALSMCYIGSGIMSYLGPYFFSKYMGISNLNSFDIFLACSSMIPLYWLMSSLQISASAKNIFSGIFFIILASSSFIFARFCGLTSLRDYLIYSVIINSLFGIIAFYYTDIKMRRIN